MLYYTNKGILPDRIDGSKQFLLYKTNEDEDITMNFFTEDPHTTIQHEGIIDFHPNCQNKKYNSLTYSHITPFLKRYFSPSQSILTRKKELLEKYSIDPANTIGVYYRGTDKKTEIEKVKYSEYMEKLKEVYTGTETILLQSDEKQFLDFAKETFPTSIVFTETKVSATDKGIHYESTSEENWHDIQYFLASILILSECKHIITGVSNCSLWICLYRGSPTNIHQNFYGNFVS